MTRDDAIEAIVLAASTTETKASGKTRKVTFLLPNDGEHPFSGMIGDRLHIVVVRLNNDETPVEEPKEDEPKRRFHELKPAAQIAMSCDSPSFREFLRDRKSGFLPDDKDACDKWVKGYLGVESKTQVVPGSEAFALWTEMRAEFDFWLKYERSAA